MIYLCLLIQIITTTLLIIKLNNYKINSIEKISFEEQKKEILKNNKVYLNVIKNHEKIKIKTDIILTLLGMLIISSFYIIIKLYTIKEIRLILYILSSTIIGFLELNILWDLKIKKEELTKLMILEIRRITDYALTKEYHCSRTEDVIIISKKESDDKIYLVTDLEQKITFKQYEENYIIYNDLIKEAKGDYKIFRNKLNEKIKSFSKTKKDKIINNLKV